MNTRRESTFYGNVDEPDSDQVFDTDQRSRNPSSARSTKERPCDACRRRKTRCVKDDQGDGKKCVLCKFHSQDCTYMHEPVARNRKRKAQQSTHDASRKDSGIPAQTNECTGNEECDEYPEESLLKQTLGLRKRHHCRHVGLTEPFSFPRFSIPQGTSRKSTQGMEITVHKVDSVNTFTVHEDQGTPHYETEHARIDAIQRLVNPHGRALVDLYFRIIHPSFPILQKDVFLEQYLRSYHEISPSLLAAIYLLSTNYWSVDRPLIDSPRLWQLAIESFDFTIYRPKLSSLQAGLLLAQYEINDAGIISSGSRGRLTAHLLSMSHTQGIHLDPLSWVDIPQWEIRLRRRLAWAVYMQDKWVSLIEGRPPLLSSINWAVSSLQPDDFPEFEEHEEEGSSEVEKGRVIFMQMVDLTLILADILDRVFSLKADKGIMESSNPLHTLIETVRPLQLRLKSWSTEALDYLDVEKAASMKLTSIGYLKLAHLAVEVSLHRRIICETVSSPADPNFVTACRAAAQQRWLSSLKFVQSLKPRHLRSFWFFSSSASFTLLISFGNLLVGSSPNAAQAEFYMNKLKEFRWTLKVNGEMGAKFMNAALHSMVVDPGEIRRTESARTSQITSPGSADSSFAISPQVVQQVQPMPDTMASLEPSFFSPHWLGNPPGVNAPVYPGYGPAMPMQMPYMPQYAWYQPYDTNPLGGPRDEAPG